MRALIVFLKDTFYTARPGAAGAAQWNYHAPDSGLLRERILGSGALVVYRLDPENGSPQSHLGGERAEQIAFFPAGGWSGYVWEGIADDEVAKQVAAAERQAAGLPPKQILVPR